jgi:hypothetical protein
MDVYVGNGAGETYSQALSANGSTFEMVVPGVDGTLVDLGLSGYFYWEPPSGTPRRVYPDVVDGGQPVSFDGRWAILLSPTVEDRRPVYAYDVHTNVTKQIIPANGRVDGRTVYVTPNWPVADAGGLFAPMGDLGREPWLGRIDIETGEMTVVWQGAMWEWCASGGTVAGVISDDDGFQLVVLPAGAQEWDVYDLAWGVHQLACASSWVSYQSVEEQATLYVRNLEDGTATPLLRQGGDVAGFFKGHITGAYVAVLITLPLPEGEHQSIMALIPLPDT